MHSSLLPSHSISIRSRSALRGGHYFDPHFNCLTDVSRVLWYAEEFMIDSMTVTCPNHYASTSMLTAGMRCLW